MGYDEDHCECEYCSNQGELEKCWAIKNIRELTAELVAAGRRIAQEDVVEDMTMQGSTINLTLIHAPTGKLVRGSGPVKHKLYGELFETLQKDVLAARAGGLQ